MPPSIRTLSRSFARGEVSPEVLGRVDLAQVQTGLQICRNFIVLPHGPVRNRSGTTYVRETKNSAAISRLLRFSFNNQQSFAVEMGVGYFRFHTLGAVLLYGTQPAYNNATAYVPGSLAVFSGTTYYCIANTVGNPPPNATYWYAQPVTGEFEVPHPYQAVDLFDVHYVQSADVMTLVHPNYPPYLLSRLGATNWTFGQQAFAPITQPPSSCTAVATVVSAGNPLTMKYIVTMLSADGSEESLASTVGSCSNDLTLAGNKNTVTWPAGTGEVTNTRYNVYKNSNGFYGFVGQCDTSRQLIDNNITADASQQPPLLDTLFATANNYPSTVSYSQQRKMFAGTTNNPQNVWGTRSATESNFTYSIPSQDDDRLSFRIAARDANAIRHIVPVANGAVILTAAAEWLLSTVSGGALTPSTILVQPQTYVGSSNVAPVVVTRSILYPQARGGRVRELIYQWQVSGYLSNDLCILASHLFDYNTIVDMDFVKAPYPILYCVSTTGQLLGMTYVPEQQVAGWHRHDTGGPVDGTITDKFESVACVPEGNEDVLYCIINRTINGQTKRYVECFHTRYYASLTDAFIVDCGVTYTAPSTPVTTVTGLTWLEGRTVSILADGNVFPQQVVTGGAVTISHASTKWQIGIPITSDLETIPLQIETQASGQGRAKVINKIWPRVASSSGIKVGPDFNSLVPYKQRTDEPYGTAPRVQTGELPGIVLTPKWQQDGSVCLRQTDPLPLTIDSITFEASIGA